MNKPQTGLFEKGGPVRTGRESPSVLTEAAGEERCVRDNRTLEEALEETFPASDPPASGVFD